MVALRLPSDGVDRFSGDFESALCDVYAGVGGRSSFPHCDSDGDILFLQPSFGGSGALR